jgi:nucleolysin TIA-1/TIAR
MAEFDAPTGPSNGNVAVGQNPAEAPKRPHLYIGNLSPRVTDYMLTEIFAVAGPVVHAKIVQDRNQSHGGMNYGFVEYANMHSAEQALTTLNGRKIFDAEVKVNWAYQGTQNKEDTQHHHHVFVGDLGPEVNDEVLSKAFGAFGSMSEARVMWDMNTGKSRGYGFLSFRCVHPPFSPYRRELIPSDKADAEQAITTMNGEWLGSRAIRVNWANQKTQTGGGRGGDDSPAPSYGGRSGGGMGGGSYGGSGGNSSTGMTYEQVVAQTPEYNSTVYVGNLIPYTTQADLIPLFQGYGYIVEIRMQADRGFAFVKLDTHQNAALAIVQLQNQLVHGRPVKCSWGKDKPPGEMGHGGHGGGHHGHHQGHHGYGGHQGYGQQQYPMVCQLYARD